MVIKQQVTKYYEKEKKNGFQGEISHLFRKIFNISLTFGVKLHILWDSGRCGCSIYFFLNWANLISRGTDISKYFREFLELRDNESQLYVIDPQHQRTYLQTCASSEDSFTHSGQNLHWAHVGQPRMQTFFMRTTETLIRVFVGRVCQKLRFLTLRFKLHVLTLLSNYSCCRCRPYQTAGFPLVFDKTTDNCDDDRYNNDSKYA